MVTPAYYGIDLFVTYLVSIGLQEMLEIGHTDTFHFSIGYFSVALFRLVVSIPAEIGLDSGPFSV